MLAGGRESGHGPPKQQVFQKAVPAHGASRSEVEEASAVLGERVPGTLGREIGLGVL